MKLYFCDICKNDKRMVSVVLTGDQLTELRDNGVDVRVEDAYSPVSPKRMGYLMRKYGKDSK